MSQSWGHFLPKQKCSQTISQINYLLMYIFWKHGMMNINEQTFSLKLLKLYTGHYCLKVHIANIGLVKKLDIIQDSVYHYKLIYVTFNIFVLVSRLYNSQFKVCIHF